MKWAIVRLITSVPVTGYYLWSILSLAPIWHEILDELMASDEKSLWILIFVIVLGLFAFGGKLLQNIFKDLNIVMIQHLKNKEEQKCQSQKPQK